MPAPDVTPSEGAADPTAGRRRPRGVRARVVGAVVAGALVLTGGGLLAAGLLGDDEPVAAPLPVPSATASPSPSPEPPAPEPSPSPSVAPQPTAVPTLEAEADIRLRVPAVGIDLPVHALEPDSGAINPPTMSDAYWIDPYGEPGAGDAAPDNTVYIAAHSWSRGDAAFNKLLDEDHEGGAVDVGDEVEVETPSGTATYRVTEVKRYGKDALPDADEVWEVSPGRLVLITCFQREDGRRSTENLVVTTELVPPRAR
ncbi:class F sortase [Pseudokineococcus lusitanus]|uniref:Sortase family protein n=1 Tax=Pseudokineococcus lusitanus TaxID=763993 RepID=A0A3N1G8N9_9ACTN|nr:class F sortase [Pseudokineococcus lusitanus]ROP26593.1 sortase family protein [Pseudokineococcus lusitanus]